MVQQNAIRSPWPARIDEDDQPGRRRSVVVSFDAIIRLFSRAKLFVGFFWAATTVEVRSNVDPAVGLEVFVFCWFSGNHQQ